MLSIVYLSKASVTFTEDSLVEILRVARDNNEKLGITGMLLYRDGRFLQILEGPDLVLQDKMAEIALDPRHDHVNILLAETVSNRIFGKWAMRYEAVPGHGVEQQAQFDDLAKFGITSETLPALRDLVSWYQAAPASVQ